MNVGSLFSGIGGIDLGLERAGMRVVWQCEADPWRRAVLRSHWPDVPCYEDVRDFGRDKWLRAEGGGRHAGRSDRATVDLLCGGFPCQDLSVAGRRAGLIDGARSNLFFEFARIADAFQPRWILLENVPGLLSSNGGRDFAVVYATLAELGYGVAWRILDSRYFGVPQRRRRVFIVGHLGARSAAPFLPFLEGGEGDPAASGEAWTDVAVASLSGLGTGGADDNDGQGGRLVTAGTVRSHMRPGSNSYDSIVTAFHMLQDPISEEGSTPAWGKGNRTGTASIGVQQGSAVRRLTPTECCRLQGFPDDWLGPPNEPPDSPKYAALGDAVTVPVAHRVGLWILEDDRKMEAP